MTEAQTYIDTLPKTTAQIIRNGSIPGIIGGKLTGDLIIRDFPELTEINLRENELVNLTIINCPKLGKINVNGNKLIKLDFTRTKLDDSGQPTVNELAELLAGSNKIVALSLKNSDKLHSLHLPNNKELKKIQGIEKIGSLDRINLTGTDSVHLIHADKLSGYKQTKDAVKKFLPGGKLPKDSNGKLDSNKLKEALKKKFIEESPLKKEHDQKAAELAAEVQKRDKLITQIKEIVKELGLAAGANHQAILTRIKELRKRPEPADIVAKDAEIAELKAKIDELNKEKQGEVPKEIIVTGLNSSGVPVSNFQKQNLLTTGSNEEFKTIMVDLAKAKISQLERERNSAYNLNIMLSVFLVLSLLFLVALVVDRKNKIKNLEGGID